MKKFILLCALLFSTTTLANEQQEFCADTAIRYTVFQSYALISNDDEESYKKDLYIRIIQANYDETTTAYLKSLVDFAWKYRHTDIVETAKLIYHLCLKQGTSV